MCCSPKISLLSAVYTKVRGHLLFGEGASLLSTCQWMTRGQLLVKMDFTVVVGVLPNVGLNEGFRCFGLDTEDIVWF